jgi:hypothetical protein
VYHQKDDLSLEAKCEIDVEEGLGGSGKNLALGTINLHEKGIVVAYQHEDKELTLKLYRRTLNSAYLDYTLEISNDGPDDNGAIALAVGDFESDIWEEGDYAEEIAVAWDKADEYRGSAF